MTDDTESVGGPNGDGPPARPASVILLLRDGAAGLEVLCLQRSARLGAFSGVLSFPGGKVTEADASAAMRARCDGAEGLDDLALGHSVAAVREAFEECGVLLARAGGDREPVGDGWAHSHVDDRRRLSDGSLTMADFAAANDLRLALDRLTLAAHWITPELEPHRFDTLFYMAEAPLGHDPRHDGSEIVEGLWITPAGAIAEAEAGRRSLVFPTRLTLMWLSHFGTVAEAEAGARARDIRPVLPVAEEREDGRWLTIPEEAGYGLTGLPFEVATGKRPRRG